VTEIMAIAVMVVVFALPCWLLAIAVRHFVPLMRGLHAPLWAYFFSPIMFLSDRFFSEQARPHRMKFIGYVLAFVGVAAALFVLRDLVRLM
jgi:hypothetical protein